MAPSKFKRTYHREVSVLVSLQFLKTILPIRGVMLLFSTRSEELQSGQKGSFQYGWHCSWLEKYKYRMSGISID
jgi:hypothetical protein